METRFGLKDLLLFLLVIALIVLVVLAMAQYDRQWEQIQAIRQRLDGQAKDLRDIQESIARGGIGIASPNSSTQLAGLSAENDPFARVRAAQALPNFARGDWLIDAFGNSVGKLTPLVSSDAYAAAVQATVLESLAVRDPETLEWKPLLASGWRIIDNTAEHDAYMLEQKNGGKSDEEILKDPALPPAMRIVFTMRDGVRFSDGQPLTADDVVFTYQFTMDPKINSPRDKAYLSRIASVEKTGDNEVTFTFKEPYFEAFNLAASIGIMPRHFYSQFDAEEFNQSVGYLLGSGPYRLADPTSWKPGTLLQVLRNDRYWGVPPAFDRLVWQEITNDVAHMQAFRNGEIDLFGSQPEQYREMVTDSQLVARTRHYEFQNPVGGYRYIAWNQNRGGAATVFADTRVRQAMTMLLDRQRMIQEVMLGYAVVATGPFNPLSKQYNPDVQPWPYDVERAKEQLRQAGFEDRNGDGVIESADGKPFEFKLTYPGGNANYEKMVLFLKDAYARAGIVLKPDPLDWSVMVERLNNKDFEAITLAWTAGIEGDIYQMFHSDQIQPGGDNFMSYRSEKLDSLITQARREIDEEQRMPLWREAHAVLHEDQPYTFLFFPKSLVFLDDRIENVQETRLGLNPREEWFVPIEAQRQAR